MWPEPCYLDQRDFPTFVTLRWLVYSTRLRLRFVTVTHVVGFVEFYVHFTFVTLRLRLRLLLLVPVTLLVTIGYVDYVVVTLRYGYICTLLHLHLLIVVEFTLLLILLRYLVATIRRHSEGDRCSLSFFSFSRRPRTHTPVSRKRWSGIVCTRVAIFAHFILRARRTTYILRKSSHAFSCVSILPHGLRVRKRQAALLLFRRTLFTRCLPCLLPQYTFYVCIRLFPVPAAEAHTLEVWEATHAHTRGHALHRTASRV